MNYEKDLTIDPSGLDTELILQPQLMLKYAKHASEMKMEVERAKEKLDIIRADLDKKIRVVPEEFGITKLTESVITSTIITQVKFRAGNEEFLEAAYEANMAQGALRALEGKKTALENLVKLHGQQYFAGPSVPRDLSKEWERKEQQRESDAKVGKKLRRKG